MHVNKDQIIQDLLVKNKIDSLLLTSRDNRFWVTNYANSSGYYFVNQTNKILFLDGRYKTDAQNKVKNCEIVIIKNIFSDIKSRLQEFNIQRIGVEADYLTFNFLKLLEKEFQNIEIVPISVRELRMIKTDNEIKILQEAAKITDETLIKVWQNFKLGKTEIDLEKEILQSFLDQSVDKSFRVVINSGTKGALPHGKASNRVINKGELVTVDFGCTYQEYNTDMTRTVAIGEVSKELTQIYNVVKEAQQSGIDAIKPNVKCSDVHQIVSQTIAKYGYEKYFLHQTGHGVGVVTHEAPRIADYDDTLLQEGMVVTIEPGIYIEGLGGVRIEDMVLVTANGSQSLTKLTRKLTNILEKDLTFEN